MVGHGSSNLRTCLKLNFKRFPFEKDRAMSTIDCPFGCGFLIDTLRGKHIRCPKVKEGLTQGGFLPWGQRIDLTIGERGGLPEDFVMPVLDTAGQVKCGSCRKWVKSYHFKCEGVAG